MEHRSTREDFMNHNIDTLKTIYDCFGRGDLPGILARFAPDIEWEHDWGIAPPPLYTPRRGRDEVPKFFSMLADYEFVRFEPIAFLEGGNLVAVPIHLELRVKATGKLIRDLEAHLWTFGNDGLITRLRHLADTRQFELAHQT
jgi:ketosteroid isomerase-like protein